VGFITDAEFRVLHQEQEISIEATPERVWTALVDQISDWWPSSFNSPSAKRFILEPFVGGRLYEDWGDGQGLLWGNVISLRKPALLQICGELMPDAACTPDSGPATIYTTYRLEGDGAPTVVKLQDTVYGRVGDGVATSLQDGWKHILHECLKPFVEKG